MKHVESTYALSYKVLNLLSHFLLKSHFLKFRKIYWYSSYEFINNSRLCFINKSNKSNGLKNIQLLSFCLSGKKWRESPHVENVTQSRITSIKRTNVLCFEWMSRKKKKRDFHRSNSNNFVISFFHPVRLSTNWIVCLQLIAKKISKFSADR